MQAVRGEGAETTRGNQVPKTWLKIGTWGLKNGKAAEPLVAMVHLRMLKHHHVPRPHLPIEEKLLPEVW